MPSLYRVTFCPATNLREARFRIQNLTAEETFFVPFPPTAVDPSHKALRQMLETSPGGLFNITPLAVTSMETFYLVNS